MRKLISIQKDNNSYNKEKFMIATRLERIKQLEILKNYNVKRKKNPFFNQKKSNKFFNLQE